MTVADFDFLFGGDAAAGIPAATAENGHEDAHDQDRLRAEAQELELLRAADAYAELLPAVNAARLAFPQAADSESSPLTGADWVVERIRTASAKAKGYTSRVFIREDAIVWEVTVVLGMQRRQIADLLLKWIAEQGNLGDFTAAAGADPTRFFLVRRGAIDTSYGWRGHGPRAASFFDSETARARVFDLVGLFQTNKRTKERRYPAVMSWGTDHRGGTATLRLRPGMTLTQVKSAEGKLRQVFRAPELSVGAASGSVDPVIHLNSQPLARGLPAVNPLAPERLVRVRTNVERYAAAGDFVLPVGVCVDDATGRIRPILVNQDSVPHAAVFGGTGSGKTVLLAMMVRAAVLQGAEVVLWDAKMGKDMRALALDRLPGVIHYAAGSAAVLHRTVLWVRHEFERRQAIAEKLAYRGIEYNPTPLLLVMDELPWWLDGLKARKGDYQKSAEQTEAHISAIAAEARELRVFFIVAGQYAYVNGYAGNIRTNTQTLISVGPPKKINMDNLFVTQEERQRATELSATIRKQDKGVGVMLDDSTNEVVKFRGFFNSPGSPEANRFAAAIAAVPRLRRFAYELPRGDAEGGDGSWADWTPASEPASDSLRARVLDDAAGRPIEEATVDDPTSTRYRPGRRPTPQVHTSPN